MFWVFDCTQLAQYLRALCTLMMNNDEHVKSHTPCVLCAQHPHVQVMNPRNGDMSKSEHAHLQLCRR